MYIHTQRKLIIEIELYTSIHQHKISYNMKMQLAQWFNYIATTNGTTQWLGQIHHILQKFFPFYTIYDDKHKNLFVLIIVDKAVN